MLKDSGQSGQWQDCRIQIGGLAIQGAEAFHRSLGPTFQDYLTQVYNGSNGSLAFGWVITRKFGN